jgi:glycosyltransferase involved in cell wall biosynthesis
MSTPTFSIVIPTYNRAGFIKRTIESVLEQTFSDFEIIVVDDGSTDGTDEVVRSIHDERIIYHYKFNEERAVARNTGVQLARGKYVTFLDSDDLLYPHHLETALDVMKKYGEPEFFHLGYEFKDGGGSYHKKIDYLPKKANTRLIEGNHLSCHGVFIRKDIAIEHKFNPDRRLSGTEDYELWLRLASRFPLFCENSITSAIIQHGGRSVITTDREKLEKRIELLERYLQEDTAFMEKFGARLREFKANNRIYIALHLALGRSDRLGALNYLGSAFINSPKSLKNRAFYGTIKRLFI